MDKPKLVVIGSYLSPYVRKVLVCLDLKGLAYEIDPLVPFYGSDEFERLSPLRRIPVLIDAAVTLADSTVICEYLDEKYPGPDLLPTDPESRARSRWLEEFADSRMGEVFIWHLYNQLVIRKYVWGESPDEKIVNAALGQEIPHILDYLEREVPAEGFLFGGRLSIGDVAIAAFFRNASYAGYTVDAARWPKTGRFVREALAQDAFEKLRLFEKISLKTPIKDHRSALKAAGAPVSDRSFGTTTPRAGLLAI